MKNLICIFFFQAISFSTFSLTSEQALELGMTPLTQVHNYSHLSNKSAKGGFLDDLINSTMAKVVIIVNESDRTEVNPEGQTAKLYHFGELKGLFNVSTGSRKIKTTTDGREYMAITREGFFRPKRAYSDYYSYTFFGSTMPYAIFFNGGIALHGTTALSKLGKRDSGGCVRFDPKDIKIINETIRSTGEGHERVQKERICRKFNASGRPVPDSSTGTTRCLNRTKHLDRVKIETVNRYSGNFGRNQIWSYDAIIIIKSPSF
jgi:hypothetical protein